MKIAIMQLVEKVESGLRIEDLVNAEQLQADNLKFSVVLHKCE